MLNNILKLYTKIIKNKKFTYFYALFALFFISFIVSNPENNFTQVIAFLFSFQIVKMLAILKILILSYYNPPLGLLNLIIVSIILSIDIVNKEDFDNIPNMVEKAKIMRYNKSLNDPKKLSTKKIKESSNTDLKNDIDDTEKEVKVKRKKRSIVSTDYYNEKKKSEEGEEDVEKVDLEEQDDTIEKELKRKHTHELKKLDEYEDSSSSDSSDSNSSDSSTDSSDSEKEMEEISMDRAREHMLNNLRNGLKKRYINKN